MASQNLDAKQNEVVDAVEEVQESSTNQMNARKSEASPITVVSPVKPYHPMTLPPTKRDERKLFVGGLPPDVTDEEFRTYFEQFGPIFEAAVMYDRITGRSRGFGFVTFHDAAIVTELVRQRQFQMRDKTIEVKAAEPKSTTSATILPKRHSIPYHYPAYDAAATAMGYANYTYHFAPSPMYYEEFNHPYGSTAPYGSFPSHAMPPYGFVPSSGAAIQ